jgi:pyrroline-5-carboxylate reductase
MNTDSDRPCLRKGMENKDGPLLRIRVDPCSSVVSFSSFAVIGLVSKLGEEMAQRKKQDAREYAVGFIGGGNMATALIRGFVRARLYTPRQLCASDVDPKQRAKLQRREHVRTFADNVSVVQRSTAVILAVKPQIIDAVLAEIRTHVRPAHVFISIAAGVPTGRLEAGLGPGARVVRVMPNTPALLGKGMAVVVRGKHAKTADERLSLRLLRAVGRARAVSDEALIDAVTGLSGSGPAFVYLFAEALIAGGVKAGLTSELAEELAQQTLAGAAVMLQETGESPQDLRAMVTSPGGTTLAGLGELERRGFFDAVADAVVVAARRSQELGRG